VQHSVSDRLLPFIACLVRAVSDGVLADLDIGLVELLGVLETGLEEELKALQDIETVLLLCEKEPPALKEVHALLREYHALLTDVEMLELEDLLEGTNIMSQVV